MGIWFLFHSFGRGLRAWDWGWGPCRSFGIPDGGGVVKFFMGVRGGLVY